MQAHFPGEVTQYERVVRHADAKQRVREYLFNGTHWCILFYFLHVAPIL